MILQTDLLEQVQLYVEALLEENLTQNIVFHTLRHTKEVVAAVQVIGSNSGLSAYEMEVCVTAAWFHDTGYIEAYKDHESKSKQIAETFLKDQKQSSEFIEAVLNCIEATRFPQKPTNALEKIICDADMFHLSTPDYFDKAELLRQELNHFREDPVSRLVWMRRNKKFFKEHSFFTAYGQKEMESLKKVNYNNIKKAINEMEFKQGAFDEKWQDTFALKKRLDKLQQKLIKLKSKNKKLKADKEKTIKPSRGIETMFRTTARNHLELSAIADNKANIMISINSIIISIIVTFMIRKLEENPNLVLPTAILLFVSLATIIFAVLSTRPTITTGRFTREDVQNKSANLLFFGNFHRMELKDYEWGVSEMMKDSEYLYGSMTRDIYFLGKVLGRKYLLLRIAYSIFMFGFALAVLVYTFILFYFPVERI